MIAKVIGLGRATAPRRSPGCAGARGDARRRARRGDQPRLPARPALAGRRWWRARPTPGWLDRLAAEGALRSDRNADVAIIAAAIDADAAEETFERGRFYASARRGRPKASHEIRRTMELRHRGESYRLDRRADRGRADTG